MVLSMDCQTSYRFFDLQENEKVYLHKKLNEEWFFGKNRRGCEGMFPCSYINVKVPIRESSSIQNHSSQATTSKSIQKSQPTARALYNFTAEAPEDLSLQVNFNFFFLLFWMDEWTVVFFILKGKRYNHWPSTNQRGMDIRSYWFQTRSISSQFCRVYHIVS